MTLDDPAVVRAEYADEQGLEGRMAAYRFASGPQPRELAFQAIAEARPRRLLEVGCGTGDFTERLARDLGAEVVALDQSERMVDLTRARGIDARVGDVQALPFADAVFDVAYAGWMLYHVPDVAAGLAELARVLRPGGRLVAVTNSNDHLRELRELTGVERPDWAFSAENGEELLRASFGRVQRREAYGWIEFPGLDEIRAYLRSSRSLWDLGDVDALPLDGPLRVRRAPVVFVAEP